MDLSLRNIQVGINGMYQSKYPESLTFTSHVGSSSVAVLPCCRGTNSRTVMPELYADLPEFPMPLELIALCMLRVLSRKGHEGKLNATGESPPLVPDDSECSW